jgi:hypothetical protein
MPPAAVPESNGWCRALARIGCGGLPLDELINDRRGRDDRDKANKRQAGISRHVPLSIVHDISSQNGNRNNSATVPIRRDGVLPHGAQLSIPH